MDRKKLVLTGIEGYCKDESFEIREGATVVMGRSRSCDISFRRLRSWMEASEEQRESAEEFKTVSRRHLKTELVREGDVLTLKMTDLSRNGTFVDEQKVGPLHEIKDWDEVHYLRLGEAEKLKLELVDDDGSAPAESAAAPHDADDADHETGREARDDDDDDDDEEEGN